jgi:Transcriptional regulators of sugar metabolism
MDLIQFRRDSIYDYIEKHGIVTIEAISSALNISTSTVRRDVSWLESQRKVETFHGGVTSKKNSYENFSMRMAKMNEEKKAIGEHAVKMVEDGDLIYIGGGSTTYEFAKALSTRYDFKHTTIVASAINIATCFANLEVKEIIIPGGSLVSFDESMISKMTIRNLSRFNFDKVFTGVMGVDWEAGYTMPNLELAELKSILFKQAKNVIILADYTKFGMVAPYKIRDLKEGDCIVTNYNIETDKICKKIRTQGIQVITL